MTHIKILLYYLFSALAKVDAARILAVFPTPSISHQIVFRPLIQELVRRGHDLIVVTTDPAFPKGQSPENLREIDVGEMSYSAWNYELKQVTVGRTNDMGVQLKMFLRLYVTIMDQQLQNKEIQDLLRNKNINFDLLLIEACVRPALIYSYIFKAPVIQLSSFGPTVGTNSIVGAPNHPLLQPLTMRQRVYNLTLWEKIRELYSQFKFEYINYENAHEENVMLKEIFGPDTPTVEDLLNNVDMVFVNVHPIWIDNPPVPPNVIYMGGLHEQPAKELPKEFLTYLESSENGTIYISFGTNINPSILPAESVKIMMNVFSKLPYNVIWKWDTDLPDKPRNIKVLKWMPQSDLLRHPKLKLFITQGGLQSSYEAIAGGVPLIGIPVIADQWFNAEKFVHLGIGLQLGIGEFTEEEFRNAIITVIDNPSYRQNILRLRNLMRDEPQTPLERATWWIEHVLRHGGARHLRSSAANMSWAEYYELKLVLMLLTCLTTIIVAITVTLYRLQRSIFRSSLHGVKLKNS